ncbi:MAG TPA: ThuA domain-containing protein [Thermoguttaceae bacterium]|nr:ThuA domain-containing protein [Thermoguttaceae bacterium]
MSCKHLLTTLGLWVLMVAVVGAAPLKALIVDGQNNHNWKETTPHLKKLLEETGLFAVDVATTPPRGQDMSGFQPDFATYDVVVSNYTGDSWPEETNRAFEKYIADGGGMVVFHAASNAFPNWKEFNEIIGVGGWGGRNEKDGPFLHWKDGEIVRDMSPGSGGTHGPQHPFQLIVRDPNHPITAGLPEKFMHSADELYSQLRGPAKNLTVLATAYAAPEQRGTGRHEPILMTITYGKGRIFHNALGHAGIQCRSVAFIATYQRGTEWAATGKVTQKVPDDFPGPDQPSMRE